MSKDATLTLEQALNEIKTKPVVDAPVVCAAFDISREAFYAAIERGEIEVLEIGKLTKVVSASLRRRLGI